MARLSGLQRDVLGLYRQCLRAVREKPVVSTSQPKHSFHSIIHSVSLPDLTWRTGDEI
jgi:hypothetical protein